MLLLGLMLILGSASAKFQRSDEHLYFDALDLAIDPNPELEYSAYAIVMTGGQNLPVIYVITSNYKGKLSVLGSFRCDKEFTVMQSQTNGMRDILCARQDVFGRKTATSLRYTDKGLYEEYF